MSQPLNKITAERNQRALLELAAQSGNDVCADCKARHPRWASYNLGIFLCVNCAGIHRKIGTHITKVKSLSLDSWTKEQVETMKQNGNLKSNRIYNPDEIRHPPPTNMLDMERDSELETYIRAKYEHKKYLNRPALVASYLGPPSRRSSSRRTSPAPTSPSPSRSDNKPATRNAGSTNTSSKPAQVPQSRSASLPVVEQSAPKKADPVWDDLISLQTSGTRNASLPLQYQANTSLSGQNLLEPGVAVNTGYSPNIPMQTLQSVAGDATGLSTPAQGHFQPGAMQLPQQQQQQQQPQFGYQYQPVVVQQTAGSNNAGPFGQAYAFTGLPVTFGATMATGMSIPQIVPSHLQSSPMLAQQIPAYLQQQQQQAMTYPQQLTTFPSQAVGQLNPQMFQSQLQAQPFLAPTPFVQSMPLGQAHQMQMFVPTGQFGGWPQAQQPQTGYQGQQWGTM